jgi:microcystin-dependent protein
MKKLCLLIPLFLLLNIVKGQTTTSTIGFIYAFPGVLEDLPGKDSIWMVCDGRSLNISGHLKLFKILGWTYGYGTDQQGRTTFSIPDYRGYFLRGVDNGSNNDPDKDLRTESFNDNLSGENVGSRQKDAIQKHKHIDSGHSHPTTATDAGGQVDSDNSNEKAAPPNSPKGTVGTGYAILGDPTDSGSGAGNPRLSNETRPLNIYVYWVIKVL